MTGTEILSRFALYTDDGSELSTTETLALGNEKYREICADRNWEFLKKEASGTLSTSVSYVSLPSDFVHLIPNAGYTENFTHEEYGQSPTVIFVSSGYTPYPVINWSDRRQYRDREGFAYIDLPNSRLYMTKQPTTAHPYEFDYKFKQDDIEAGTSPLFPEEFHPLIYLAMAIDDDIIQRFEKARSYAVENRAKYNALFNSMALWNSQFQMN